MIKLNGEEFKWKEFPDGTLNMNDCCPVLINRQYLAERGSPLEREDYVIEWTYSEETELIVVQYLTMHLKQAMMATNVYLVMPYIPNARMDRTKKGFSEVFTLKYFAQVINSLGFATVFVCDPHSNVSTALIDRVSVIDCAEFQKFCIEEFRADFIFFPDAGAQKRYEGANIRTPLYGEKDRDWTTGAIRGLKIINPYNIDPAEFKDKRVLIIDDICSRGGTFHHSAKALKELGFGPIGLCVTHLENSVFHGELLKKDHPIVKIYATNSLYHAPHDKIETLEMEWD